jgi:hypothetical protein
MSHEKASRLPLSTLSPDCVPSSVPRPQVYPRQAGGASSCPSRPVFSPPSYFEPASELSGKRANNKKRKEEVEAGTSKRRDAQLEGLGTEREKGSKKTT